MMERFPAAVPLEDGWAPVADEFGHRLISPLSFNLARFRRAIHTALFNTQIAHALRLPNPNIITLVIAGYKQLNTTR